MTMKNSITAKIAAIIIYLFVALPLFYLGVIRIITQEEFAIAVMLTVTILIIAIFKINRDEKRKQQPEPSESEKH